MQSGCVFRVMLKFWKSCLALLASTLSTETTLSGEKWSLKVRFETVYVIRNSGCQISAILLSDGLPRNMVISPVLLTKMRPHGQSNIAWEFHIVYKTHWLCLRIEGLCYVDSTQGPVEHRAVNETCKKSKCSRISISLEIGTGSWSRMETIVLLENLFEALDMIHCASTVIAHMRTAAHVVGVSF